MSLLGLSAVLLACVLVPLAGTSAEPSRDPVDFDRDVRPILSENCFACHGFDANARRAGLRLDVPEGAVQRLEMTGHTAVVPGKPGESELVRRITTDEESERMPP